MSETDNNVMSTPRIEPSSSDHHEPEKMTRDTSVTDSNTNTVTTPRTEPMSTVDCEQEGMTTEMTEHEDNLHTASQTVNVESTNVTTDEDTTSKLPTLNQILKPEQTNVPTTDTTTIDLLVGTEDENTLPELEKFDYDLDTDMSTIDKMAMDDDNATLVPVDVPKQ